MTARWIEEVQAGVAMSNVLIGIIGVILFIGLALAGALFLGPRFQEAALNSEASSVMSGIHQVAMATDLNATQEGKAEIVAKDESSLYPGYLKSQPKNLSQAAKRAPSAEYFRYSIHLNNDLCPDNMPEADSTEIRFIMTPVGYGEGDDKLCRVIVRNTGSTMSDYDSPAKTGCIRLPNSCGLLTDTIYIAYERL